MHGIPKSIRMLTVTLATLAAADLASAGPRYRIELIGHEPGGSNFQSVGYLGGLNNRGEVAFSYNRSIQVSPTFSRRVSDSFVATNAGTISVPSLGADNAQSLDINDSGMVVGGASSLETYPTYGGEWHYHVPFVSQDGLTTEISTPDSSLFSFASAANNSGEVVGQNGNSAFKWSGTEGYEDLGAFGSEYVNVIDINERSEILINLSSYEIRQFGENYVYNPQEVIVYNSGHFTRLPTTQFEINVGESINDFGRVVGAFATVPGVETHAYVWDATSGYSDLGNEGEYSYATDINNSGVVIGEFADDYGQPMTPFVYSEEFGRQRLFSLIDNPSGWLSLDSANHINDRGQITGIGQFGFGNRRIYLATPIPEPPLLTLLGALAFVLTSIRRRGSI